VFGDLAQANLVKANVTTPCQGCKVRRMNWHEHIAADPAVLVGKPVIRGSRLTVEFILGLIVQGWPEQEITRNYRLTPEQVRACAAYAQERLKMIPQRRPPRT
jgi:uncharacterized protein (DUF433 family)